MSAPDFVHLRLHSEYSLSDGLVRLDDLVQATRDARMPAVAVTDNCNFYGLIKFYKAAQSAGIKPVAGADCWLREDGCEPVRVTFLVMNPEGYQQLVQLISRAWREGQELGVPYVRREWIAEHSAGLIVLSGAQWGDVGRALMARDMETATRHLGWWQQHFPQRYYLEISRAGREHDEDHLHAAVALAQQHQVPVVATNDVRFLCREDFEAHETRFCIAEGYVLGDGRRPRPYTEEQYLKTPEEMAELFSDIPEALANSVEIARRCSVELRLGKSFLPDFDTGTEPIEQYFERVSHEGLELRLERLLDRAAPDYEQRCQVYLERLRFELDTIIQMGFPGYFLIVMEFIQWAKDNGIPVGPGRGSGAGSLVAYALKITDLDPLAYDLLFERFLNPERVSMPDFDVDFCMENRDRVIEHVKEKYGYDAVSQIATFGTMAAKAVVRDVARVQGKSYGMADRLSKMIPGKPGTTLDDAFGRSKRGVDEGLRTEELINAYENDEEVRELMDMAFRLEGLARGTGKHAGGVVIAPGKLTDFSALHCDETGELVTQFDKDDVEQAGLVKFDFLGLRNLTVIDWALKTIAQRTGLHIDISQIPLDDKPSYDLLQRGDTTAVFQLESRGMKELIRKLKPSCFEDIIALVALYRPGPLESGMVDDFINRKHGRAEVAYPHPEFQHECLQPVLAPTYGVIVYQEQVMQIAQVMGAYTLGGADMLRRAMGKKKPEEMAQQRGIFMAGAASQQLDAELAGHIFDLMEKFAGYGFNKSHSAAYALVAYQTAWLKRHYPAEYMAAVLSSEMHNTDSVVTLMEECRAMGLRVMPPNVNTGCFRFTVNDQGAIVYGLGAIKGVGEGPVESIEQARAEAACFPDLFDFCRRVDIRKINKRTMEALIRSGALDELGPPALECSPRAVLLASLDEALHAADQQARNADAGMVDLFGDVIEEAPAGQFTDAPEWSDRERLQGEKDTLGLYLTGHPVDSYENDLRFIVQRRLSELEASGWSRDKDERGRSMRERQTVAGIVVSVRIAKGRGGGNNAFVVIDDRTGRLEMSFFGELYEQYRNSLVNDALLIVEGEVSLDDYSGQLRMRASRLLSLTEWRLKSRARLQLHLDARQLPVRAVQELVQLLTPHQSAQGVPVLVDCHGAGVAGRLLLGEQWKVMPEDSLLERLRERFGRRAVNMLYQGQ